jgi:hypothetical protein
MSRKNPSEENRELARYTADVFGGTWKVPSYDHDHIELSMPILSCPDRPRVGATAYATVGARLDRPRHRARLDRLRL